MAASKDDTPKQDQRRVDKDPTSTWGANEEAKQAWEDTHGEKTRKANQKQREKDTDA